MIHLEGISGWRCCVCQKRNASRVVICPCGESQRPTEIFLRAEQALRDENKALRFWVVLGWSLFVAVAWIAVVQWWAMESSPFLPTEHTENTKAEPLMGADGRGFWTANGRQRTRIVSGCWVRGNVVAGRQGGNIRVGDAGVKGPAARMAEATLSGGTRECLTLAANLLTVGNTAIIQLHSFLGTSCDGHLGASGRREAVVSRQPVLFSGTGMSRLLGGAGR